MKVIALFSLIICLVPMAPAMAESLFVANNFTAQRSALVQVDPNFSPPDRTVNVPSLFIGQTEGGMFAPFPVRASLAIQVPAFPSPTGTNNTLGGTPVARLRHLIAQAEAGRAGYDAVQHGASVRPSKAPTNMTIAEIYDWIKATPGQPHAIGRYQFIPATLRRLVSDLGIPTTSRFSPEVQDALADLLFIEAGFGRLQSGEITRDDFMHNLAKIWAGLPLPNGASYYDGHAGNKATLSWAYFDGEMARIFGG